MPRFTSARCNGPRNSGPRPLRRSIGSGAGTACSTTANPPFYRWFPGARLNTCWNALDRHVAAGHGERVALIWDSPVTGAIERLHLSRHARPDGACRRDAGRARGAGRRPRADLYADGARRRRSRCSPAPGIGAMHSVVFGGFAAHELATRIDDARPRVVLGASCGIEVNRIVPYKPLLDAAIAEARAKPEACVVLQRPMCRRRSGAGPRPRLAGAGSGCRARPIACRSRRPTRSTSSIPRARPVFRKASCATMADMRSRWRGRCATSTASSRRGVLDRFRCRLGGRAFVYRLRAAAPRLHLGHVRGQAGRHPGCRRLLAGHRSSTRCACFSRRRLRSARSSARTRRAS